MRQPRHLLTGSPDEKPSSSDGKPRYFHVVTRTAGQEILFGDTEKENFHKILFKQLKFSGLRALSWCFMGNHLHLLLEVPDKEKALEGWAEEDFIGRLAVFKDEMSTRLTLGDVEMFRGNGHAEGVSEIVNRVRARLFDLSTFMKELKQRMTIAYNYANGRKGTLWEGRFKCTLVHYGEALRAVAAYIDLNPVRAGLVDRPEDYRWCSYAAAVGGMRLARSGLSEVATAARGVSRKLSWKKAQEDYRQLLFGIGQEVHGGKTPDGYVKSKGGFTQREIEAVCAAGGKLSLAAVLRCRVRYFTDGVVLGNQTFVDDFFAARKGKFGKRRESGARRMKGADWGGLRVLRALRLRVVEPPGW